VVEVYSLVLGWGSLFNHSFDHNTEYWHDTDRDLIVFHTIKSGLPANNYLSITGKNGGVKGSDPRVER
jgi:hypothetical protein